MTIVKPKPIERNERGQIMPGSGGRQPGTRNKLQGDFIDALAKDFQEHGEGVIRIVRTEDPVAWIKVIASVLPREWLMTDASPLAEMSDEDLAKVIAFARSNRAKVIP
jgi:hypothetical protein